MIEVVFSERPDFVALGERWRALEDRSEISFFQSWTWTGCLPEERFPDPILADARENGETVGLALFNRQRHLGRDLLYLGETGDPARDGITVEHNGPIFVRGHVQARDAILRAAAKRYDLVLGGIVGPASGHVVKTQPAPFARPDATWFGRRSANMRQQLRRAERAAATFGPIVAVRADRVDTAENWLDEMAAMHQATWTARGKAGSFADPFFDRFHHALIRRGMPRDEIDLWRITAGPRIVGILYNFRLRGLVSAYQSGFAYDPAFPRFKPGLICHRRAIDACAADGVSVYDFLAGGDRYKRSLADGTETMRWLIAGPWWSPRLLTFRARSLVARGRDFLAPRS